MRALAIVVALSALLLGGCGGEQEEVASAKPTEAAPPALEPDRPAAPTIEGVGLDGETISLESFRGRPVLLNVWSSW